jgi:hypothetical protein
MASVKSCLANSLILEDAGFSVMLPVFTGRQYPTFRRIVTGTRLVFFYPEDPCDKLKIPSVVGK